MLLNPSWAPKVLHTAVVVSYLCRYSFPGAASLTTTKQSHMKRDQTTNLPVIGRLALPPEPCAPVLLYIFSVFHLRAHRYEEEMPLNTVLLYFVAIQSI